MEAEVVLFCYRKFASPKELLDLLIGRYAIPMDQIAPQIGELTELFEKKIELPIKERFEKKKKRISLQLLIKISGFLLFWAFGWTLIGTMTLQITLN